MRKSVLGVLFVFVLSMLSAYQFAYGAGNNPSLSGVKVVLNSQQLEFDVNPYIKEGRTMVPFRKVLEEMKVNVAWNKEQRKVLAYNDVTKIQLVIGEKTALVNGKKIALDVPSEIKDGRTFIPLRFFSENLGASVKWISENKTVDISYSSGIYTVGTMASFGGVKVSIDSVTQDPQNRNIEFTGKTNTNKSLFIDVVNDDCESVLSIISLKLEEGDMSSFEGIAYLKSKVFVGKHFVVSTMDENGRLIRIAQFDVAN